MVLSYPFFEQLRLVAVAILILCLPGLVWLLLVKKNHHDILEKVADTIGLSISMMAILAMIFFYAGLRFSGILIGVFIIILAAIVIFRIIKTKFTLNRQVALLAGAIVVFGLVLFLRLYQARDLTFPAWVDSVHHVLISQKILDIGGLPQTLAPELNIPFHYHYGFHLIAALFSWISGLEPLQTVLWFGQLINALVVFGIYRLSKSLWKESVPAILAALLVAFAFQMPAYFVTWGRYTLLTGLLVMLPAMAASYELVRWGFTREGFVRLIILTAGLALVHYLALFYFGLFLLSLLLKRAIGWYRAAEKEKRKQILFTILPMLLASAIGILIAFPWLLRMLTDHTGQIGVEVVLPQRGNLSSYQYILYLLGPVHNYFLMGGAMLGLVLIWWRRGSRDFALWSTLMLLLSFPWGLRFGPFRPDHMAIVMFIPASLVLSYAFFQLCKFINCRVPRNLGWVVFGLVSLGVIGYGAWQTRNVINSVTILADQADSQALDWIETNLPQESRFFTNTTIWQFRTYRGVDGGYWILPKTGRFALALPGLYGYADQEEREQWVNWMERASVVHACDDGFWSLVKDSNLSHVYLREGKGSLQPAALVDCPNVTAIYQQEGVYIYEIQATESD